MKPYLINNLEQDGFSLIITILEYQVQISKCLKSIRVSPHKEDKLLIDTLLCSGMNEYRFIEATFNENGTINLEEYKYVDVSNDILSFANDIIRHQPIYLKNSVIPESQVKSLYNTVYEV